MRHIFGLSLSVVYPAGPHIHLVSISIVSEYRVEIISDAFGDLYNFLLVHLLFLEFFFYYIHNLPIFKTYQLEQISILPALAHNPHTVSSQLPGLPDPM